MSSSYSCEMKLRDLASELHAQAYDLERAAETLAVLRNSDEQQEKIKEAKQWAKDWMK